VGCGGGWVWRVEDILKKVDEVMGEEWEVKI
jgi:hypothetical protein